MSDRSSRRISHTGLSRNLCWRGRGRAGGPGWGVGPGLLHRATNPWGRNGDVRRKGKEGSEGARGGGHLHRDPRADAGDAPQRCGRGKVGGSPPHPEGDEGDKDRPDRTVARYRGRGERKGGAGGGPVLGRNGPPTFGNLVAHRHRSAGCWPVGVSRAAPTSWARKGGITPSHRRPSSCSPSASPPAWTQRRGAGNASGCRSADCGCCIAGGPGGVQVHNRGGGGDGGMDAKGSN